MSPNRYDATLVKGISKYQELAFHFMPNRTNSNFLHNIKLDLEETNIFLDKVNKDRDDQSKITLFEIILASLVRTVVIRDRSNRFVAGRRLWQRNEITISFVVKREKTIEGDEVNAKTCFSPYDTLETISNKMKKYINKARHGENPNDKDVQTFGKLPRFILSMIAGILRKTENWNMPIKRITKTLPFYSTVFLAHLGSLNMDGGFHHLFEMGTTGFFITLSKVRKDYVINQETGEMSIKPVIDMSINIDERIADGIYWGATLDHIRDFVEHPAQMMEPIAVTDEMLEKLALKDYPPSSKKKKRGKKITA